MVCCLRQQVAISRPVPLVLQKMGPCMPTNCVHMQAPDSLDSPEGAAQVLQRPQQGVAAVGQPP